MRGPSISEAELEVLKILWEHTAATVRDVSAELERQGHQRRAYTTVQTLLQRLEAKGYVTSDKGGQAKVYRAAVSREDLVNRRLRQLADELCGGTASPLVLALVEGGQFSRAEIRRLRDLLDRLDPPRRGRPRPEP
jgi:predicted transcriptional regulator